VGVHLSWQWQLGLFAIGVLLAVYAWYRYARQPMPAAVQQPPVDALGTTVTLATDLRNGEGMVSIDGARWPVTGPEMVAGSRVRLTAIDDSTFTVEPVDQDQ
jgi:membrane protein implicated in regulation of membrane protease activity